MDTRKILINTDFDVRYENNETGCSIPILTYHDLYEIYILETGTRTTMIDDKIFDTRPLDAAMFHSLALHQSYGDTPYSGTCFHFSNAFLDMYFSKESKKELLNCFNTPIISLNNEDMLRIKAIARAISQKPNRKFIYLCGLLDILYTRALSTNPEHTRQINTAKMCSSVKLSEIMNYINRHFCEIKNINELCERFAISEGYLCREFKKQTGMTIVQYINMLKINYACRFLSDQYSQKTVSYISNECGFESSSYFIRVFKKITGRTPSAYRAEIIGSKDD